MRRMLFAHARTPVADLRTAPAQQLCGRRQPTHPAGREGAEVGAVLAQPDAEVLKFLVDATFHADHVIGATIAELCTGGAGIETVLHVSIRCLIMVVHNAPLRESEQPRPRMLS